jgi:hypothetical protein
MSSVMASGGIRNFKLYVHLGRYLFSFEPQLKIKLFSPKQLKLLHKFGLTRFEPMAINAARYYGRRWGSGRFSGVSREWTGFRNRLESCIYQVNNFDLNQTFAQVAV